MMNKRHNWENNQCLKCGTDKRHEQMMARKYDGAMSPCPSWAYERNIVTGEVQQRREIQVAHLVKDALLKKYPDE